MVVCGYLYAYNSLYFKQSVFHTDFSYFACLSSLSVVTLFYVRQKLTDYDNCFSLLWPQVEIKS